MALPASRIICDMQNRYPFGWRLATVLAKDWYVDRSQEIERIVAILERTDSDAATISDDLEEDEADIDEVTPEDDTLHEESIAAPDQTEDDLLNLDDVDADHDAPTMPSTLLASTTSESTKITDESVRYLEFRDGKSNKFWEISLQGNQHMVRFGRIGAQGQSQTKIFPDRTAASRDADRLIREKTRKGYREAPAEQA